MQNDGWVIRLRQIGTTCRMEYKAPANDEWTAWIEYGTEVENIHQATKILTEIGLRPGLVLDRTRRTTQHGLATLALDFVKGLGHFIEVETESNDAQNTGPYDLIRATIEDLGLTGRPVERPYGELALTRLAEDPNFRETQTQLIRAFVEIDEN
jgi:predicted adenylyl cyclase CyaB